MDEIKAEIAAAFGTVPPLFAPAEAAPAALERLWSLTRAAYVESAVPAPLKERLLAYLARFCPAPYSLIYHSCALGGHGVSGDRILAQVATPPAPPASLDADLARRRAAGAPPGDWPALDSPAAEVLSHACARLYLDRSDSAPLGAALAGWLGQERLYALIALVGYARECHFWTRLHPDLDVASADVVRRHHGRLVAEAPALTGFFRDYPARVAREQAPSESAWLAVEVAERREVEAALHEREEHLRALNQRLVLVSLQAQELADEAEREREQLQTLFQQAPSILVRAHGPRHTIAFANPAATRAWGHTRLVGLAVAVALPELARAGLIGLLDRAYRTGESTEGTELPATSQPGPGAATARRYFNFVVQPTRDAGGQVVGVLLHAVDVTEQVHARNRVLESAASAALERDRLRQVVGALPEGVVIVDRAGSVLLHNAAAERLMGRVPQFPGLIVATGATESEPAGHTVVHDEATAITRRLDGSLYTVDELPLVRSIRDGETVLGEQFLLRQVATGRDIPVLANTTPLHDADGQISGAVATFQDISVIRDFERARDEFLASVSHDLKTPLTAIRGLAQLSQRQLARPNGAPPERLAERLAAISAATRRMDDLVNELLDLARLDMGQPAELVQTPTDLAALTRAVVTEQQGSTDRHRIWLDPGHGEPPVVRADPARLSRALANLISNALKYSPAGGEVGVRLGRETREGREWAVVAVEDRGLGVPDADLPHIFQRFWRGGNVVGRIDGTGIGLASVRQIVLRHGGTISVHSREGYGSTFTVRLPLDAVGSEPR